jgi:hypothetical protein
VVEVNSSRSFALIEINIVYKVNKLAVSQGPYNVPVLSESDEYTVSVL